MKKETCFCDRCGEEIVNITASVRINDKEYDICIEGGCRENIFQGLKGKGREVTEKKSLLEELKEDPMRHPRPYYDDNLPLRDPYLPRKHRETWC